MITGTILGAALGALVIGEPRIIAHSPVSTKAIQSCSSVCTISQVGIFCDRIEKVGLSPPVAIHRILGNALAHEIGHVLLRSGDHSEDGIMKEVWTRADYQRLAARLLAFLPQESPAMRNEVSRRTALSSESPL